jgi:hypothetical protein
MAKKLVRFDDLKEEKASDAYLRYKLSIASRNHNIEIEARDIIKKAREDRDVEAVIGLWENDIPVNIIAKSLKITQEKIKEIIEKHKNKA